MMRWLASRSASFWFVLRPSAAPTVLHWQSWLPARVSTREASKKEGEAKLVPWMRPEGGMEEERVDFWGTPRPGV